MKKTIAIKPIQTGPMMVTWDLGRRCNYDCSYCEDLHHNNYSRHRTVDELKHALDFIKEYIDIYNSSRTNHFETHLNFTGGEPTVNPNFWDLVDYVKQVAPKFKLSLTTNGTWHSKHIDKIIDNFMGVTVSYHTEADITLKKQVLENIYRLNESGIWVQVNLMMHVDHWDECVEVYHQLKEKNVLVKLRPIGDGNMTRTGWFIDNDGNPRRTSHQYTVEQQEWFWRETGIDLKPKEKTEGTQLGRQCCGNRPLCGSVDGEWENVKMINTEFKDWYCMVDWYFLHIDQETELVYHHQTCQATHGKKRGSIGSLSNTKEILDNTRGRLNQDTIDTIICPNQRCGCGMCVPKAKSKSDFDELFTACR